MIDATSFEELLAQQLEDEDFREHWERTVLARSVAEQVIGYRIEHNLSQRALAQVLGVSQPVVGRLELGEHEPKMSTLSRLSRTLGLSFNIDIQPAATTRSGAKSVVNRVVSGGVELIVTAS